MSQRGRACDFPASASRGDLHVEVSEPGGSPDVSMIDAASLSRNLDVHTTAAPCCTGRWFEWPWLWRGESAPPLIPAGIQRGPFISVSAGWGRQGLRGAERAPCPPNAAVSWRRGRRGHPAARAEVSCAASARAPERLPDRGPRVPTSRGAGSHVRLLPGKGSCAPPEGEASEAQGTAAVPPALQLGGHWVSRRE